MMADVKMLSLLLLLGNYFLCTQGLTLNKDRMAVIARPGELAEISCETDGWGEKCRFQSYVSLFSR